MATCRNIDEKQQTVLQTTLTIGDQVHVLLTEGNDNQQEQMFEQQITGDIGNDVSETEVEIIPVEKTSGFGWCRESVNLLLVELAKVYGDLKNPASKGRTKQQVWEDIKRKFHEKGYNVSWRALQKKWSNIHDTYRVNKLKLKRRGRGSIKWEFYNDIEAIVEKDASEDTDHIVSTFCPITLSSEMKDRGIKRKIRRSTSGQDLIADIAEDMRQSRKLKAQLLEEYRSVNQERNRCLRDIADAMMDIAQNLRSSQPE